MVQLHLPSKHHAMVQVSQGLTSVEGHRCRDLATASTAFAGGAGGKCVGRSRGFGQGTNITASSTNGWTDPKI